MAEIRINKLMRQFNVGLADIVDFLRKEGADIDENPNFKVSDEYLPALHERFGKDAEMKKAMENVGKLLKNDPDAQPISINSGSTKAKKKAAKKAISVKSAANKKSVPAKAAPAKPEPKPVFDDGLDWGAFSADNAQQEPIETAEVDTSELEMKICEAVKGIIDESILELSPESRLNILQCISDALDFSLELSATEIPAEEEEEEEEEMVASEPDEVVDVDFEELMLGHYRSVLVDYFANTGSGKTMHEKREKVTEFLKTETLVGDDFWDFVDIAMGANPDVFRKPFADGVQEYSDVKEYRSRTGSMRNAIDRMMANKEKFKQTVDFLLPFTSILPDVTKEDIRNNFKHLTEIASMQKVFTMLDCNLDRKLYLLSSNDSVDSIFLGLRLLVDYKDKNGIDAIENLKFFYPYLNCMEGPYGKELAGQIIRRRVLDDAEIQINSNMSLEELLDYDAFCKAVQKYSVLSEKGRRVENITALRGKTVDFIVSTKNKRNYLVNTRDGYQGILPVSLVQGNLEQNQWYRAQVIKTYKSPLVVILSQKPLTRVSKDFTSSITLIKEGDIAEARFQLSGTTVVPNIIGYGPLRANIVKTPANFNYKVKHKVKVVKVTSFNRCDIEVLE